jgi:hypothetical protein
MQPRLFVDQLIAYLKARWQSGHAADCNSVNAGSIPTRASIASVVRSGFFVVGEYLENIYLIFSNSISGPVDSRRIASSRLELLSSLFPDP